MQDTKIALVQMQSKLGQVEKNLFTMKNFIQEAADQKVDIICFPEMCIKGYSREISNKLAESVEDGNSVQVLKVMAREHNIVIIAGMAEKGESYKPFITQVVVKPNGTVEYYRKAHLGKSEQPYFSEGNQIKSFITEKAKIGIQICWDTHFPEMTTILSLRGTEIIFAPHASPTIVGDRRAIWLKYLAARAYDNSVFVAACNLVGDNGEGHKFCGGNLVLDPKGNILAEDFSGKESMLVVDLEAAKINAIREQRSSTMANSFYLRARRPELYNEIILKDKELLE